MPSNESRCQTELWPGSGCSLRSEASLIASAYSLCLSNGNSPTPSDQRLWNAAGQPHPISDSSLSFLAAQIAQGLDPLGDAFCILRSAVIRRDSGATYTPLRIVEQMTDWAKSRVRPERVVDPGCGSARFLIAAARQFPDAHLIGIENDPLAALVARANLSVCGLTGRAKVLDLDYRSFVEGCSGQTLYIGNPPYVRHHKIDGQWKHWLFAESARLGHSASKLAGLHVHFFLATARASRNGDIGAFITAAEWLDVNYGDLVRRLLLTKLGGTSITLIDPAARPFPDAATTAAITTFEVGTKSAFFYFKKVSSINELAMLQPGQRIHHDQLEANSRWSYLTHTFKRPPQGYVELGEFCRVHRGQVTGANDLWIAGHHSKELPVSVLFPTVTKAREVIVADGTLDDPEKLRRVIDLPVDLDSLDSAERAAVERFLCRAKALGAHRGYIASHRRAWWSVGLRVAAPIISTYMARRTPAFVLNRADARHINIAHGIYPREQLDLPSQRQLVNYLQQNVSRGSGRTYAGGLTKFEPREMERLIVPGPALLAAGAVA